MTIKRRDIVFDSSYEASSWPSDRFCIINPGVNKERRVELIHGVWKARAAHRFFYIFRSIYFFRRRIHSVLKEHRESAELLIRAVQSGAHCSIIIAFTIMFIATKKKTGSSSLLVRSLMKRATTESFSFAKIVGIRCNSHRKVRQSELKPLHWIVHGAQ